MSDYYDGTKLLSMKDINGNTPEIYMCTANNTAGKTTYFSRLLVNRFFDNKDKFMLIYRFSYELDDCADKFYKDIGGLFFEGSTMTTQKKASGSFCELYINDKSCGYAVSLNNVDNIKKFSHLFNDTKRMFMDEFQSETNHYCTNEINKFRALHKAVARGQGEMVRYVPVYMCSNPITILNPYYIAMNISNRINNKVKFLITIDKILPVDVYVKFVDLLNTQFNMYSECFPIFTVKNIDNKLITEYYEHFMSEYTIDFPLLEI